ncbi:MAG: phosphotransferase, partial [Aggregatilineales bacterium]
MSEPLRILPAPQSGKNNPMSLVQAGEAACFLREYGSANYTDPTAISYENTLLKHLSKQNLSFAVPLPILNRAEKYISQHDNRYFSLTPKFSGKRLNPANLIHVEQMGRLTGQMHRVLADFPMQKRPGRSLFTDLFGFADAHYDVFALTPGDVGIRQPDTETRNRFAWWHDELMELQFFVDDIYST